jgi:hypothetical protein
MRAILGILYMEGEQAKKLGLPPGVLVLEAPPGSPAYEVRDRLFKVMAACVSFNVSRLDVWADVSPTRLG